MMVRNGKTLALALAILFLIVGPSPSAQASSGEEQTLRERATEYWNARVKRDPAVLGFYPPQELRPEGTVVPEGGAIHFKSFVIENIAIEGDDATLEVRIESEIKGRKPFAIPDRVKNRTVSERWVKIDGTWFKQTAQTALKAVGSELKTAFERRAAERAAAAEAEAAAKTASASLPGKRGPQ